MLNGGSEQRNPLPIFICKFSLLLTSGTGVDQRHNRDNPEYEEYLRYLHSLLNLMRRDCYIYLFIYLFTVSSWL